MRRSYGVPPEGFSADGRLRLALYEGPLGLDWAHAGSTAEFLADVFAEGAAAQGLDPQDARHSIAYLVNELLENAVKFGAPGDVRLDGRLADRRFFFRVETLVPETVATRFEAKLVDLLAGDPSTLLLERIEANAQDPGSGGSGLGILTLLTDYDAALGWSFTPGPDHFVVVQAHAAMPLG